METYSRLYDLLTWIHINSKTGLRCLGFLLSVVLKVFMPKKYREIVHLFYDYIAVANLPYDASCYKNEYIACLFVYGSFVKEFFMYDFIHLNDSGRREYITEINRYKLYPKFNGSKKRIEMQSKFKAYEAFQPYYQREAIFINQDTTYCDLERFFMSRETAFLKPNMSGCGKGVEFIRLADYAQREEAYNYILSQSNSILEEQIIQTGFMKQIHPQSVNTVRVYACRLKDGIHVFGSHMRVGLGSSIVDNAAAGGIIISINNDGIAWTSGVDEFGNTYLEHPDTHVFIPGMKMPDWEKALHLIDEVMGVYPDIRFVGWDLAYTNKGWIIVEANDNGQFHGAQIPYHRGWKKEIESYIKDLI